MTFKPVTMRVETERPQTESAFVERRSHSSLVWAWCVAMMALAMLFWSQVSESKKWEMKLAWLSWSRDGVHDVRLYELGGVERRVKVRDPDLHISKAERDYARAVLLIEDGQFHKAAELAWQLCGTARDADGRELMGIIYARQEIHSAAVGLLRGLLKEQPDNMTVRQSLIWVLAQDRRTIYEAQALAMRSAGEQANWPFAHMVDGIRRRRFWRFVRTLLLIGGGGTLLVGGCWAMVWMLCNHGRKVFCRSATWSRSRCPACVTCAAGASQSRPPSPLPDMHFVDVESVVWHAVNLLQLARYKVSRQSVRSVIESAARNEAEFFDARWRRSSNCFRCLGVIGTALVPDARHQETVRFWRQKFTALNPESRARLVCRVQDALHEVGVEAIYRYRAMRWREEKRRCAI